MREKFCLPQLPLAIYREIAAHLRQIQGVEVGLVTQQSEDFDYLQSQIDHLWLEYPSTLPASDKQRLQEILAHYTRIHRKIPA